MAWNCVSLDGVTWGCVYRFWWNQDTVEMLFHLFRLSSTQDKTLWFSSFTGMFPLLYSHLRVFVTVYRIFRSCIPQPGFRCSPSCPTWASSWPPCWHLGISFCSDLSLSLSSASPGFFLWSCPISPNCISFFWSAGSFSCFSHCPVEAAGVGLYQFFLEG